MDNSKKTKISSKCKKTPKSKLLAALKKKKECENKALSIVIELIDGGLDEDDLLNKLGSINVCHYEDVVEERFILKQCGYVNCNQQLTYVPKQQYKISLVDKKIYDITERKKFCSNLCYKSSEYLKSQLLTSPLWLRDTEIIPKFKLLETVIKVPPPEKEINSDDIKSHSSNNVNKEDKFDTNEKLKEKMSELKI